MRPLIRSACLTNYVPLAESAGLDAHALIVAAGIDPACLDHPDIRISATAFSRLIDASVRASGWPDFGLRLIETRQISVLGPIALVVREQATGRKALDVLFRYLHHHSDSTRLWIEEDAGLAMLHVALLGRGKAPLRHSLEMTVGTIHRALCQLLAPGWVPRVVCFAHAAPASLRTHRRIFGKRIEFNAPFTGIVCRSAELDAPRQVDPAMELYARQYVDSVVALPAQSTADKVRQLAVTLLPAGRCSLEQVADHLGGDVRTVRRRLLHDQTSFNALLHGLRQELVIRYLETPERQLSEIAQLLGFASLSAFSRWFQAQFGRSATAWRALPSPPISQPTPAWPAAAR